MEKESFTELERFGLDFMPQPTWNNQSHKCNQIDNIK